MSINNQAFYALTNSDLMEIKYSEINLTVLLTKLAVDTVSNINVYIDSNDIAIIKLNGAVSKYWLFDLAFSFNRKIYDMMRIPRYHANPFNLVVDIYDDRNPSLIISLTGQNINQAYEYVRIYRRNAFIIIAFSVF